MTQLTLATPISNPGHPLGSRLGCAGEVRRVRGGRAHRRYASEVVTSPDGAWTSADVDAERAWLGGGDDALSVAWEQFGSLVFTYCRRSLNDYDSASDCTQETFVSAWRSRDRFDPAKGTLAGWLVGIARYRVLDAYRSAGRTPTPRAAEEMVDMAESSPPVDETIADQLLVAHALEALPDRARQVVELAFHGDLTQQEIAARLDLPLGTVKSDMRRALLRLRTHMEGGELDV